MTTYGYFLSSEEHLPSSLIEQAVLAEQHGFDALWVSDHYHPWNDEQGQSPFVWSVLGAIATHTQRVRAYTAVTEDAAVASTPCGPDVADFVEVAKKYVDAGVEELYLSQIGPDQQGFFDFWDRELRDALADL